MSDRSAIMNLIDFVNKGDFSLVPDGLKTKYTFKEWSIDTFLYVSDNADTSITIEHPYYYAKLNPIMTLEELVRIKANNQMIDLTNAKPTPKKVIQKMLDDGWSCVPCAVSEEDLPFSEMIYMDLISCINHTQSVTPFGSSVDSWVYAIPFDPKTSKQIIDYVDGEIILGSRELL